MDESVISRHGFPGVGGMLLIEYFNLESLGDAVFNALRASRRRGFVWT